MKRGDSDRFYPDIYKWTAEVYPNFSDYALLRIKSKVRRLSRREGFKIYGNHIVENDTDSDRKVRKRKQKFVTVESLTFDEEEDGKKHPAGIDAETEFSVREWVNTELNEANKQLVERIQKNFIRYFEIVNQLDRESLRGKEFKEEGERKIDERKILAYHTWLQSTVFHKFNPLFEGKRKQVRDTFESERFNFSNTYNFHKELKERWETLMPHLIVKQTDLYTEAFSNIEYDYLRGLTERVEERNLDEMPFLKIINETDPKEKAKKEENYYKNSVDKWVLRIIKKMEKARNELKEANEKAKKDIFDGLKTYYKPQNKPIEFYDKAKAEKSLPIEYSSINEGDE